MGRPCKDVVSVNVSMYRHIKLAFDQNHMDSITGKVKKGALSDVINRLLLAYLRDQKKADLTDLIGE